VREHEGLPRQSELLYGAVPDLNEVFERDVRYSAAPWSGQKTGAFLDQRENRARAGELAHGSALDCFTYHGLFALHLARSASEVVAVDSSNEALERARANADMNGAQNLRFECANVFDFLRAEEAARRRYDIVVLDPPAFAKRRDAIDRALRGYKEINLRAMRLLSPGGILCTFSCSYHVDRSAFRAMLASAAADAGRPMRLIEERKQSLDHPEVLQIPETSYLKGAILQTP
ncbi:MAG: class I SAM-dependent rRNA methyltransferase, partial [Longimicrobiales bacterium]